MQQFQFRLDRVLEWYNRKTQLEENRLATCLGLVHTVERNIARLRAERDAIEQEILQRSPIPAPDFHNLGRYRLGARKEELDLAEEYRQRLASAEEQRLRVQRARQRVKLLEKMKDRRLQEYTIAASRELEAVAAEAYLARWSKPESDTTILG